LSLSAGERARDNCHDTLDVGEDVVVPESEHPIAARLQRFSSSCIGDDLTIVSVAIAVNLDDESVRVATKIHEIVADRALPAKMAACKSGLAKMPPQFSLRRRHHAAQLASERHAWISISCFVFSARHGP